MMSEDPYVARLLELAKQNLHANAMAQAIPMIVSAPVWAERTGPYRYGRVPEPAGGWPNGMLIIPEGLRGPKRAETRLSHHTDPDDFGRYGAVGRDNSGGTGTPTGPVKIYLSDCPTFGVFAPLELGLWA